MKTVEFKIVKDPKYKITKHVLYTNGNETNKFISTVAFGDKEGLYYISDEEKTYKTIEAAKNVLIRRVGGKTSEVKKSAAKKIKGKTVEEFIDFLESTLIPDLKESGTTYTAQDFETAVKWIKHFKGEK